MTDDETNNEVPPFQQTTTKSKKKGDLGSIIIDTQPPASGNCPFHTGMYILLGSLTLTYCAFLMDRDVFAAQSKQFAPLGYVHSLFLTIEKYSPFMEVFETDEELIQRLKAAQAKIMEKPSTEPKIMEPVEVKNVEVKYGVKLFTKEELAKYDGSPGSPGLYLALMGQVFDVSKGKDYYGPGGGYSFFSGRDASRAFVTGDFEEKGLIDNVEGLTKDDYMGLEEWSSFYNKDYTKVGLVSGNFYTPAGLPTPAWHALQASIEEARQDRDKHDVEKNMFPPCNVEWTQAKGSRFWCTNKSGGVARSWVGVPRQLFYPGRQPRCACVRDRGPPSVDPSAPSDTGDLDSPHVKAYPGCEGKLTECWHNPKDEL